MRQRIALVALFCVLPVLAIGGGLALAPLATLAGIAVLSPRVFKQIGLPALAFVALVAWAAASTLWAPAQNLPLAGKILGTLATGLALVLATTDLPPKDRVWVSASVLAAAFVLIALCVVEAVLDMPFNRAAQPDALSELLIRNPGRGVFVLDAIAFGAIGAALSLRSLYLRIALIVALVATIGLLSVQFDMTANAASFVLGGAFFILTLAAPRLGLALMGALAAFWMLAAPWVMLLLRAPMERWIETAPASWGMRVQVWTYAADKITLHPILGWGLESSRHFDEVRAYRDFTYDAIPLHPHSISLQIWLELGLVGALLATAVIVLVTRAAIKTLAPHNVAAAAASASAAVLWLGWNLSYGAWQEWYLALTFIAAAAALALRRSGDAPA